MTNSTTSSIVPMGTWHHDHMIDFSDYEWQRVIVGSLQVGSRFRLEGDGNNPIDYVFFVVLRIFDNRFFQVAVTKCVDRKKIEKSFQELSLKASGFVLVVPAHEQMIASSGATVND